MSFLFLFLRKHLPLIRLRYVDKLTEYGFYRLIKTPKKKNHGVIVDARLDRLG